MGNNMHSKSAKKTKEELLRLRHDMMEYGNKVNPKLKAKTQMKSHHHKLNDNATGYAMNDGNNSTKAGNLSKEKEELLSRLAQGIKPKVTLIDINRCIIEVCMLKK